MRARQQILRGIREIEEGNQPLHANGEEYDEIIVVSKVIPRSEDHIEYWRKFAIESAVN